MVFPIRLYASPATSLMPSEDSSVIRIFVIKSQQYLMLSPNSVKGYGEPLFVRYSLKQKKTIAVHNPPVSYQKWDYECFFPQIITFIHVTSVLGKPFL